jgi:hypothetical protein
MHATTTSRLENSAILLLPMTTCSGVSKGAHVLLVSEPVAAVGHHSAAQHRASDRAGEHAHAAACLNQGRRMAGPLRASPASPHIQAKHSGCRYSTNNLWLPNSVHHLLGLSIALRTPADAACNNMTCCRKQMKAQSGLHRCAVEHQHACKQRGSPCNDSRKACFVARCLSYGACCC